MERKCGYTHAVTHRDSRNCSTAHIWQKRGDCFIYIQNNNKTTATHFLKERKVPSIRLQKKKRLPRSTTIAFSRCKEIHAHTETHTYKYLPASTRWITLGYRKYYPRHKSWGTMAGALQRAAVFPRHSKTQRKVLSRFVSSALYWESWPGSASYYLLWLDLKVSPCLFLRWGSGARLRREGLDFVYECKSARWPELLSSSLVFSCGSISLRRCAEAGPPKGLFRVFVVLLS